MAFLEFEIPVRSWTSSEREILSAKLAGIGFEGFVEQDHLLQAYIEENQFSDSLLNELIDEFGELGIRIQYRFHRTPDQNWNEEWEKQFTPVTIGDRVLIRAPFHPPDSDLPLTLVIEPKMSFGTGHHHTTVLMIESMLGLDMAGQHVLDMGCGTGVLGILACNLGAARVLALDNDQWAYENAIENAERNGSEMMEIRLGDAGNLEGEQFGLILANITRNILIRDLPVYTACLDTGGHLLLSGFLSEDVQYILNAAYNSGLEHRGTSERENWISLEFIQPERTTGWK